MIFNIKVVDRVAKYDSDVKLICANNIDQVKFEFDEEWAKYNAKTARFIWGTEHADVEFTGDTCNIPVIKGADKVYVGVYVGEEPEGEDVVSTTRAVIPCDFSIRCGSSAPSNTTGANYTNQAKGFAIIAEKASENAAASAEEAKEAAEGAGGLKTVVSKSMQVSVVHETYDDNGLGDMDVLVIDGNKQYGDVAVLSDGVAFTHVRLGVGFWACTIYTTVIEFPKYTFNDGYYGTAFGYDGDEYVGAYGVGSSSDHPTGITLTSATIGIIKDICGFGGTANLYVEFFA